MILSPEFNEPIREVQAGLPKVQQFIALEGAQGEMLDYEAVLAGESDQWVDTPYRRCLAYSGCSSPRGDGLPGGGDGLEQPGHVLPQVVHVGEPLGVFRHVALVQAVAQVPVGGAGDDHLVD